MKLLFILIMINSTTSTVYCVSFDTATTTCQDKYGMLSLPIVQSDKDHQNLVSFMIKSNISTAWLGWKAERLKDWTWMNSQICNSEITDVEPKAGCGNLDALRTNVNLYTTNCHEGRHGFICQYPDNTICSDTSSPDTCIKIGVETYVASPRVKDWYEAYNECMRMGASMAVLNSDFKIKRILRIINPHSTLGSTDMFYVGLSKIKWTPVGQHGDNFRMLHSKWAVNNQVFRENCTFISIKNATGVWFSSECSEDHKVICRRTPQELYVVPSTTRTSSRHITLPRTTTKQPTHLKNVSLSHRESSLTEKTYEIFTAAGYRWLFISTVITAVSLAVLIGVHVVQVCRQMITNKRNGRHADADEGLQLNQ